MKKPSKAQLEVLQKMNNENLLILFFSYQEKTAEFYLPEKIGTHMVDYNTFCALWKANFIELIQHKESDRYNAFYQISELGKQLLNGKD